MRSRILYWFRTPPGVRVGRAALDEVAIREIEQHNPDVEFDWTRILKGQGTETPPAPVRQRPDRQQSERQQRRPPPPPRADALVAALPEEPSAVEELDVQALDEPAIERGAPEPEPELPMTPAHAKLGSEGLLRLRARFAEVMARISERVQDPAQQEQLKAQAERLNPDTWVTADEVTAGLEQYESTFEVLRGTIGGGPRRRRNRQGDSQEPS